MCNGVQNAQRAVCTTVCSRFAHRESRCGVQTSLKRVLTHTHTHTMLERLSDVRSNYGVCSVGPDQQQSKKQRRHNDQIYDSDRSSEGDISG